MPCEHLEGGVVICRPGRFEEIRREEIGERWCFLCRKRRMFVYVVVREVEPSYYDPRRKPERVSQCQRLTLVACGAVADCPAVGSGGSG